MSRSLGLIALSSALVAAQTTTIDVLFPVEGIRTVSGTVIAANPEVTTFALHCDDNANNVQCHILGTQTVVQGASTLSINYSFAGDDQAGFFSEDLKCNINHQEMEATCSITIETDDSNGKRVTTSLVTTETALETRYIPAVITEGAEKLGGAKTETITSAAVSETAPAPSVSTSQAHSYDASGKPSTTVENSETAATETPAASSSVDVVNDAVVRKARGVSVGLVALVVLTMLA